MQRTDFVIVGSGIAGLRAAADLAAAGHVLILTKADLEESNTGYAQGGIAAAMGPDDSADRHATDTIAAGAGLCVEPAVLALAAEGIAAADELVRWGARFDRDPDGRIALGREGAHQVRRVLHARDATGREIGRTLWTRVAGEPRVVVHHHARAIEILVEHGRALGVRYVDAERRRVEEARAEAVLLATGGAGQVFSETTNPAIATGDGVALAWRAGALVADLEFVQFHPTALSVPGAARALLSEALRGEGARLLNADGEAFMVRYEAAGDLASRDLVSRAMVSEMARSGRPVYLSLQHLDPGWVHDRFPTVSAACRAAGFDLARDLIPVGPAAHYMMGGVATDLWGRTSVPGLYAAGEVACTGVHGANRLASNSLLEGLVFGARAARAMREPAQAGTFAGPLREVGDAHPVRPDRVRRLPDEADVRTLMWEAAGVVRDGAALAAAVARLRAWDEAVAAGLDRDGMRDAAWRLASLVTVGHLIARAALRREESRGGHHRADFPTRDDVNWKVHVAERIQD